MDEGHGFPDLMKVCRSQLPLWLGPKSKRQGEVLQRLVESPDFRLHEHLSF